MDVNLKFIQVYPEWILRQCKIKENTTKRKPIIKLSQLSHDILCQNKNPLLRCDITPHIFGGYEMIIDNSLDIGVCDIVIIDDNK